MARVPFGALTAALGLVLISGPVGAATTAATGAVVKVAAPASVLENAYESDTEIRVFDEQQDAALAAALDVDITGTGTYDELTDLTPGAIPAGTPVSSHLLHADPVGAPESGTPVSYTGTVTFDADILGVIVRNTVADPNLNDSDLLGTPGTVYPTGVGTRGLEFFDHAGGDIVVAGDMRTLSLKFTMHRFDQIRVITEPTIITTTTTTAPPTTTTTAPPETTTTTTAPPASTTTSAPVVAGTQVTNPTVLGATLPRTGTAPGSLLLVGLLALALGRLAIRFGERTPTRGRSASPQEVFRFASARAPTMGPQQGVFAHGRRPHTGGW